MAFKKALCPNPLVCIDALSDTKLKQVIEMIPDIVFDLRYSLYRLKLEPE
jgi:hypothetical protein